MDFAEGKALLRKEGREEGSVSYLLNNPVDSLAAPNSFPAVPVFPLVPVL